MDAVQLIRSEIKTLTTTLEGMSKRLRKVEVLSRLSASSDTNTFLQLLDVDEDTYNAQAGLFVRVNLDETALEFSPVGSACVTFICGSPGWRGYGGNPVRTLVHEEAFQSKADGNARGDYAIDLQTAPGAVEEIAGANYSVIIGGEGSQIDPGAEYSSIVGYGFNYILDDATYGVPYACHIYGGCCNEIIGSESYEVVCLGEGNDIRDCDYGSFIGVNHNVRKTGAAIGSIEETAFGVYALIENNAFRRTGNVYPYNGPTYSGSIGILNWMYDDVFNCYQFGENNYIVGDNTGGPGSRTIWMGYQMGYGNELSKGALLQFQFGEDLLGQDTSGGNYLDGRMMLGNGATEYPPVGTSLYEGSGYNQSSWFSQYWKILAWAAAWTNANEFPIMLDSIWFFEAYIAGTELGCANSYAWKVEGVVENDGGTTTILAQTVTNVYRDVATKEWQVVADDVNDRLVFQYRDTAGADLNDCNIQLLMHTAEVGFNT